VPRSLFPATRSVSFCATSLATLINAVAWGANPSPVIDSRGLTGSAPFTVHLNGLNSTLGAGDLLTACFDWDFGDSAGQYNTICGWNVAHIYSNPGTYAVKLTITNQSGTRASTTVMVNVASDLRSKIFVSAAGNDSNNGSSSGTAVKTMSRAAQLLGNNTEILLRRGDHFAVSSEFNISQTNVMIGAYGSGANPVLDWAGATNTSSGILGMNSAARDVVIQDLELDSPAAISLSIVRGVQPDGVNITLRNCFFRDLSYAINCERGVDGFLVQDCSSAVLGAYFSWVQGTDHSYLGNTCPGSSSQHILRLGGCDRCLIARNTITNNTNSTIWSMLGAHVYIADNTLSSGRCIVGPNAAVGSSADRFQWAVIENNHMSNEGFGTTAGAEHVMIRNNVIERNDGSCITIDGYLASMNRTSSDVRVVNNTGINTATSGRFLNIGTDVQSVLVANNMYSARNLQTGSYQSANVFLMDSDMSGVTFRNNLWSNPAATLWGNGWHYYWPYWSDVNGYKTPSQWAANSQVTGESYRTFTANDFSTTFRPTFNASVSFGIAGVLRDCYGAQRPAGGTWTAGAVELNPVSGGGGGTLTPDVNGNGVVNIDDLMAVLAFWGPCPTSCPADVNHDGAVNIADLLEVLNAWS
jgi:PKD repeat protein